MHIRYTNCKGLPIVEEHSQEPMAFLSDILIHPDLGKVEGVFVQVKHFMHSEILFLSVSDITHWGRMIMIRDRDVLAPLEEHVRLQAIFAEGRTVLGQKVMNEVGKTLGYCKDVQFETKTFRLEWIFLKKLFQWTRPLPVTAITEVRTDAIIVRDQAAIPEPQDGEAVFAPLDPLKTTPLSRSADFMKGE